ncbi:MAG TPA: hypothetical protein PLB95_05980 [Syntrophales bacterium]|nr:hypothetical protein [Syntrophales bacterium]
MTGTGERWRPARSIPRGFYLEFTTTGVEHLQASGIYSNADMSERRRCLGE